MKKGRHRRFEEARAMKRDSGANTEEDFASWLSDIDNIARNRDDENENDPYADDPYAKYLGADGDDEEEAGDDGSDSSNHRS